MANRDVTLTLREAVDEVFSTLTGLDLTYDPQQDRFISVARHLNRALRMIALENEWSYFSSTEEAGVAVAGVEAIELNSKLRPRIINDDAVRLVTDQGVVRRWAYFLPRDAIFKYGNRAGLWVAVTRTTLQFSRPFSLDEEGLHVMVPVMREPKMFKLPTAGENLSNQVLNQTLDFDYSDLVVAKAAQLYAETDPLMQPRVQSLESRYKDLMYQLVERDTQSSDSPFLNDYPIPMLASLDGSYSDPLTHWHPHADERYH